MAFTEASGRWVSGGMASDTHNLQKKPRTASISAPASQPLHFQAAWPHVEAGDDLVLGWAVLLLLRVDSPLQRVVAGRQAVVVAACHGRHGGGRVVAPQLVQLRQRWATSEVSAAAVSGTERQQPSWGSGA